VCHFLCWVECFFIHDTFSVTTSLMSPVIFNYDCFSLWPTKG
jgi:hypothetical protein